ncbi:MAG: CoA pyrophosphatase [Burkholderiaceae bacterium]
MALSFDPLLLPVLGRDDHLPPVSTIELHPMALRRRFGAAPAWSPEIHGEAPLHARARVHASVLVPLVLRDDLSVLLTQRTDHLTSHPGQISFPGGRTEPGDADAVATALREAHEEIGLPAAAVDVLGSLPIYTTGTGFVVTPVIGLVDPAFEPLVDPFEVAEVFEVPLAYLMSPAHHQRHRVEVGGVAREFLSMPYQGVDAQGAPRRYFIWGATAAMLRNLYRFLSA